MRFLPLLTALIFAPLSAYPQANRHHVSMVVEANQITLPLSICIKGRHRTTVDARLEAIRKELEKRFADQPGWELHELAVDFAKPENKYDSKSLSSRSTKGSKLFGDEDVGSEIDNIFVANARWDLRAEADKGHKGAELLRTKAADLVNPKSADERQIIGNPEYLLSNPEDYRNDLLDQIKADFEEAKRHLPDGQWTLELNELAAPVNVMALGGKRFELSLKYQMSYTTPKPNRDTK